MVLLAVFFSAFLPRRNRLWKCITLCCHGFATIGSRGCYSWITVVGHGCRSEVWGHYVPIRHRFKLGVTLYWKVTRTWRLLNETSPLWTLWVDLLTDVRDWKIIGFLLVSTHSSPNSRRNCDVIWSVWRNKATSVKLSGIS